MNNFSPDEIASLLSRVWELHKGDSFRQYLADTCGRAPEQVPQFVRLHIARAESGDVAAGILRSAAEWWLVDDGGCRTSARPELPLSPDAPENCRGEFYLEPIIRFYCDGARLLIGERYGPRLFARKVGTLTTESEGLILTEQRVLQTYDSL